MLNVQPSGNFRRCITLQTKNLIFGIIMLSWLTNYTNMIVYGKRVSEAKPRCKGEPLEPEVFSKEGDVGFMRDVCVDIIARNVNNKLGYPVAESCQKLANTRTATCSDECVKWKRLSRGINKATIRINTQSEALLVDLLQVVWNDYKQKSIDEKFLFDCVNDAKHLLIDSAATTKDSTIIGCMEDLKKLLCRRCALSENKDLMTAIDMIIRDVRLKTGAEFVDYRVDDDFIDTNSLSGIIRLKFWYKKDLNVYLSQVIIEIPTLAPLYHTQIKDMNIGVREAHFYSKILPALYKLGRYKPFAPILYEVTPERVLVLEDLEFAGYKKWSGSGFLDKNHCQILLKILAMYHALSYVYLQNLNENDPDMELIRSYQFTISWQSSRVEYDALCKLVKPFLNRSLHTKLVQLEGKIISEFAMINYNNENSMKVIIHGDFHTRNVVFKYDTTGRISQAKIINWQLWREASPILDLIEFFIDDIQIDIITAHEDDLLNSYLTTLNRILTQASANRQYSRSELDNDIKFYKYYIIGLLSHHAFKCSLDENAEVCKKSQLAKKIAKWMIYLQQKGFLES